MQSELPNIVTILAEKTHGTAISAFLHTWENLVFSLIIIGAISLVVFFTSAKIRIVPGRAQAACELYVGGIDDFVCGIIGPAGRKFVPFIGTLFIYILFMNLSGLVPLMKSSTSSWSTTMALALCVFFYLQYTSIREHGIIGYVDRLLGRPRGIIAATVFVPIMMLVLHIVSELVRPISLSLRLRSNIWGDDMLMAVLAGFGIKGLPILFFNSLIVVLASIVQAVVFCLLATIYFALALANEEV
jgi:F-type H+-transporting ATPase subunit a